MKEQAVAYLLILFAAGCTKVPPSVSQPPSRSLTLPGQVQAVQLERLFINIVSEPSGARIDVDGHYAGKTPLIWAAPREKYQSKPIAIVAHPLSDDQQSKKKILHSSRICSSYKMPQIVYFDMLSSH